MAILAFLGGGGLVSVSSSSALVVTLEAVVLLLLQLFVSPSLSSSDAADELFDFSLSSFGACAEVDGMLASSLVDIVTARVVCSIAGYQAVEALLCEDIVVYTPSAPNRNASGARSKECRHFSSCGGHYYIPLLLFCLVESAYRADACVGKTSKLARHVDVRCTILHDYDGIEPPYLVRPVGYQSRTAVLELAMMFVGCYTMSIRRY